MARPMTTVQFRWNAKATVERVAEAAIGAAHLAAESGARVARAEAPGSVARNVTVSEKRTKPQRQTLTVHMKSRERSGANPRAPYHSAYTEWGTAKQPGQHYGLKALKAARQTLDRNAEGMV